MSGGLDDVRWRLSFQERAKFCGRTGPVASIVFDKFPHILDSCASIAKCFHQAGIAAHVKVVRSCATSERERRLEATVLVRADAIRPLREIEIRASIERTSIR